MTRRSREELRDAKAVFSPVEKASETSAWNRNTVMEISRSLALVIGALLTVSLQPALAATYYVDAVSGRDAWSGTNASASSSDGPWQSLARLASASLQPGDSVLLRCGQVWRDGLKLTSSGTAAEPITIGAYPAGCTTPPIIDGTVQIPWHNWASSGSGTPFKTAYPANLIRNGDFTQGTTAWNKWSPDNAMTMNATTTGCPSGASPCLAITGGSATTSGLASSYSFELEAARKYKLIFDIYVPAGSSVRTQVRRAASPWETIGASSTIGSTGAWQRIELPIQSATFVKEARLDFEVKGSTRILVDNVSLQPVVGNPIGLFVGDTPHVTARHPNPIRSNRDSVSPYITLTQDGNFVNQSSRTGSSYLPLDRSNPAVPSTEQLLATGVSVYVRPVPWILERRRITAVSGDTAILDSVTSYPLRTGFGYFFTGARWMLDEAGEWLHDSSDGNIYLRTVDLAAPGTRVSIAHVGTGIDVSGLSDINIRGVVVRRTGAGINMSRSSRVRVQDCAIQQTINEGILAHASRDGLLDSNAIVSTGGDAVRGTMIGYPNAVGLTVTGNTIRNSGVLVDDGDVVSIPAASAGAISAGIMATVERNEVSHTAYHGITVLAESRVQNNSVDNACAVLDDCGGIYVAGKDHNSVIQGNVIRNLIGNLHGRPGDWPHSVGIYLDELSSGITVSQNTVENAEYGIQLHNAARNTVQNNTIYGNRRYQLWLQEGTKTVDPQGDISGNVIESNKIFPTGTSFGIVQESSITNTYRFAQYDQNAHSGLLSRQVARERWTGAERVHNFSEWQAATALGVPRNLDPNGKQITQAGYTSFQVAGETIIAPIDLSGDISMWRPWNATAPKAIVTAAACGGTPCITLTAGGSPSLVSTPNFSVQEGQWYRISFDLRTPAENQKVTLSPRRGGGGTNGYELFVEAQTALYGSTTWKRHTLIVQSRLTINAKDPVTGDNGARLDFQNVPAGQQISLANVEMVPLRSVGTVLRTTLLANPGGTSMSLDCPDRSSFPEVCDQYITFPDKAPISWPYTVDAHSSEIIYTQDSTLVDSDGDGIADIEDDCPGTKDGVGTNSRGCGV